MPTIEDAMRSKNGDNVLLLEKAFAEGAQVDNNPVRDGGPNKTTLYLALNTDSEVRENPEFFGMLFKNGMVVDNSSEDMNSLNQAAINNPTSKDVIEVLVANGASHAESPNAPAIAKRCEEMGITNLPTSKVLMTPSRPNPSPSRASSSSRTPVAELSTDSGAGRP